MRATIVVLVGCLALVGCSDGRAAAELRPAASDGRAVSLPDLSAVELRSAREGLEADGIAVRADGGPPR